MVEKGSIAIEGISLTIARWEPGTPQGRRGAAWRSFRTPMRGPICTRLKAGQPVNIEADVLIKFMEQRLVHEHQEQFDLTVEYLIANGY